MTRKNKTDQELEQLLNSLEGLQKVEASPFFYTRVLARLEQPTTSVWDRLVPWFAKPVMAYSIIAVCLFLNTYVYISSGEDSSKEYTIVTDNTLEEGYSSSTTATLYDY